MSLARKRSRARRSKLLILPADQPVIETEIASNLRSRPSLDNDHVDCLLLQLSVIRLPATLL